MSTSENNTLSTLWKEGYVRLAEHITELLPDSEDATILELGCGRGQLSLHIIKKLNSRMVLVDTARKRIDELKKFLKTSEIEERVEAVVWDAENLKIRPGSVDAVVSNFFFGWLSPEKASNVMGETKKVLKEGGLVLHSDFNPVAKKASQAIVIEQGRIENNIDPSVRWWSPDSVCGVLKEAGFNDIKTSYFEWKITFDYAVAAEQLKLWGTKPQYIKSQRSNLLKHGMELPESFIITARKGGTC